MNTSRFNITLPRSLAERLRSKPNKSAFIAMALEEKIFAEEKEHQNAELALAYRAAALECADLIEDWDAISGEGL